MTQLPTLVQITPEGRIVAALFSGHRNYSELKSLTGLSDRWLSNKLKNLSSARIVQHDGKLYLLTNPRSIIESDPIFAQFLQSMESSELKARLIADEIGHDEQVVGVILFGSIAKQKTTEESDIDLLVVTGNEIEDRLNDMVYHLMFKYDVPVEAVFLTYEDLIINLQAKTSFSFGLLEGYRVLLDRGGLEGLFALKEKEMKENWTYDEEAGAWLQKKLTLTSRLLKSN